MRKPNTVSHIIGFTVLLLFFFIAAPFFRPVTAKAEDSEKTVRVGWYESSFNATDSSGRRSGYAYEYQMKIAGYSGWKYSYVNGNWSDLMEMLIEGKIDLMSDVSYTEERAKHMLFPELPMGTEEYCVFITTDNQEISPEDYSSLNGKRVGVNKGSIQAGMFLRWAEAHQVRAELTELSCTEAESLKMLEEGRLDAYVTPNAFADPERLVPVWKVGSSDYFFVVNKDRPDGFLCDSVGSKTLSCQLHFGT